MAAAFKIEITAIRIHQMSRKRNISCYTGARSIYLFDRTRETALRFRKRNASFKL